MRRERDTATVQTGSTLDAPFLHDTGEQGGEEEGAYNPYADVAVEE